MTTYVIKRGRELDELDAAELLPFVDASGHLDIRIEGEAASRPFAVLNVLRSGGFIRTHTWVEPASAEDATPLTLRVTADLPHPVAPEARTPVVELPDPRTALHSVGSDGPRDLTASFASGVPGFGGWVAKQWRAIQSAEPVRTERPWPTSRVH